MDVSSFKNMIKHSTKLRGACKPAVRGKSLECDWFYPINLGFNVFITEKNMNVIKKNMNHQNWVLKNKRVVNFTTGLHMMSEKSGKDNVYDLVPNTKIKKRSTQKYIGGAKKKQVKKLKKKIRKHKGINQKTGRLNKGYKYSGKTSKTGLKEIIKK